MSIYQGNTQVANVNPDPGGSTWGDWANSTNEIITSGRSVQNTIPDDKITESSVLQHDIRDILGIGTANSPDFQGISITKEDYENLSTFNTDLSTNASVDFAVGDFRRFGMESVFDDKRFNANVESYFGNTTSSNSSGFFANGLTLKADSFSYIENLGINQNTVYSNATTNIISANGSINANTIQIAGRDDLTNSIKSGSDYRVRQIEEKIGTRAEIGNGIEFSSTGDRVFVLYHTLEDDNSMVIVQYDLSVNYDLSTAEYSGSRIIDEFGGGSQTSRMAISDNGNKLFVTDGNDDVYEFVLVSPFDIRNASYEGTTINTSGVTSALRGIDFSANGSLMHLMDQFLPGVYQYDLSVSFDISSAVYNGNNFVASEVSTLYGGRFGDSGNKLYLGSLTSRDLHEYDLSTPYDISTASFNGANVENIEKTIGTYAFDFNNSGNNITFVTLNGTPYNFNMTTPWSINSISNFVDDYDTKTLEGISLCRSIDISNDGKKLFINRSDSRLDNKIYEYDLQDPWNQNSARKSNNELNISNEFPPDPSITFDTNAIDDIKFVSSGSSLYVMGANNVYQYELTEAYNVATAQVSTSYDFTGDIGGNDHSQSFTISNEGNYFYIMDDGSAAASNTIIHQYEMSSSFNLSTASKTFAFDPGLDENGSFKSFNINKSIDISEDGTKFFLGTIQNEKDGVYSYTLSTPFDLSTATFDGNSAGQFIDFGTTVSENKFPNTIRLGNNGKYLYVKIDSAPGVFPKSGDYIERYDVSINGHKAYSNSNLVPANNIGLSNVLNEEQVLPSGGAFTGNVNFDLTFNANTLTANVSNGVSYSQRTVFAEGYRLDLANYYGKTFDGTGHDDLTFNNDGSKMYTVDAIFTKNVHQFSLSTKFDLSTASYISGDTFDVSGQDGSPRAITFNNTGSKMYMAGRTTDNVYQYSLSTEFDITTASYTSGDTFDVSGQDGNPYGLAFNNTGSRMYITGGTANVYQYDLSTEFDITTAVYNGNTVDVGGQQTISRDLIFNNNGSKMYMVDGASNVYQYDLSTEFDITTAVYNGNTVDVSDQDGNPFGLAFSNTGLMMYISGGGTSNLYQFSTNILKVT